MGDHSIVYWYPSLEKHMCGYCKNPKGNISHGMWAKTLTVEDYQNLIDRGWRRSGNYCYKPLMDQICCPMYTIKCDVLNFQLSKSQKKVIKKLNKFLKDGELKKSELNHENSDGVSDFLYREPPKRLLDPAPAPVKRSAAPTHDITDVGTNDEEATCSNKTYPAAVPGQSEMKEALLERQKQPKSGIGADPTKPPCKKAKLLRLERKKEKLLKRGMSLEKLPKNEQKSLEEFLNEAPNDGKHKLKLQLIHTKSRTKEWEKLKKIEFTLYRKYQMSVHNDPPEKCKMEGFLRFLVNSPLQHIKFSKESDLGFGSFHQLYWLDDKLIAVGVIDILPKCVSAVYFFYDPDYRDLTLGTYGSLREVEFARSLHQIDPSIENYYMGFYIHSCQKMRYKGKLTPSYLLCPETYYWTPIEQCLPKLEVSKYSRFEDETVSDENSCTSSDVDEMRILVGRELTPFKRYKRKYGSQELFNMIGQLVGLKCAKKLIFISDH